MQSEENDKSNVTLKESAEITKKYIIGKWQSIGDDYPGDINVQNGNSENEIKFFLSDDEAKFLKFKEKSHEGQLIYLDNSSNIEYVFSIYEKNKLLLFKSSSDKNVEGISKPWILKKVD